MTHATVHTLYPRGCNIHRNQLTVDLPEHLIKALEAHATARNATIKDTVADLIHDTTGANCRRYGDGIADRYLRSLVEETEDIVREIQAQDDDLQHRPMWEYGLAMRFHRGAIELLDGENKLRDREYEISVGEYVSISDIAASFRNEPWAVNLLAVIEMYEGLRHSSKMLPALHWAKQQLQDSLQRAALRRLAGEPKVAASPRANTDVDEIVF